MFRLPRIAPALLLLATAALVAAQTPEKRSTPPAKSATPKTTEPKSAATLDAEQQLRVRRSQARSLLIALSTDARAFNDQVLRARSLARIAHALWQVDTEQARMLFRKAWDAAELADI